MELKISCGNVSQALAELKPGESLIVPCNGKTTQSTQSSIGSMLARRQLASAMYSPVSYTHLTLPTTPYV